METGRWNKPDDLGNFYRPPNLEAQSPGLEVGEDPYRSPHTGWPDASKPVWGLDTTTIPIRKDIDGESPLDFGGVAWKNSPIESFPPTPSGTTEGEMTAKRRRVPTRQSEILWGIALLLGCFVVFGGAGGGIGWLLGKRECACERYV
jgi:hypothetical protein